MASFGRRYKISLSASAKADVRQILDWSHDQFGLRAAKRYRILLRHALADIASDPERPGSQERPDLGQDIFVYHLRFSRERAHSSLGTVANPRHFVVYWRRKNQNTIEVLRILHDSRDLARHLHGR